MESKLEHGVKLVPSAVHKILGLGQMFEHSVASFDRLPFEGKNYLRSF